MIHGKRLIIKIGGTAIAAARECSLDYSVDTQEISSPSTGTATEVIPKRSSWTLSANGLIPASGMDGMLTTIKARTKLTVTFTDGVTQHTGYAYMTSLSVSGNVSNIATYRIKLQGTGELS